MKRWAVTGLLLFLIPLVMNPPEGSACGPFLPRAQFGFARNPPPSFLHGELGIVKPEYYRRNLIVAYRYLSHAPLTASEIAALSPQPPPKIEWPANLEIGGPLAAARWLLQRNAVAASGPIQRIDVYRTTFTNDRYGAYPNCLDGAFDSATATLANRAARWGMHSAQTGEWINGQDQVFANCNGHPPFLSMPVTPADVAANQPRIPPTLPAGADPLLLADRQYQIAAANFYAGLFTEAEKGFREVAANRGSPWREWGMYLTARTLIRQGTVGGGDPAALARAEKALEAILHDPKQARRQASARGLLEFVRARLHPEDRMVELGAALSKPGLGSGIEQAVIDYTAIWDSQQHGPPARSGLADWITALQRGDHPHAVERWRAGGGTAWLVAALASAQGDGRATPELIAEARKLRPVDPAYATAAFHAIRLLTARRQPDEAREWADAALAAKLPLEAQNALRAERLRLARDWTEFLRYAARRPVAALVVEFDDTEDPHIAAGVPAFDDDAASALNRKVPLGLWIDAGRNALLPSRLQAQIVQAGWVRAALLDRTADARTLAQRVAELRPELAAAMRSYQAEKSADAAKFHAIFLMLRTPGLQPIVRAGFQRETKVSQIDPFRDNWWKLAASTEGDGVAAAAFLSDAQRAEGAAESGDLLATAAIGPACLCDGAVTWGRAHRGDPRVPEALHLAVRATRYGAGGQDASECSHKAFELLHARYPNSVWATKTKYWY